MVIKSNRKNPKAKNLFTKIYKPKDLTIYLVIFFLIIIFLLLLQGWQCKYEATGVQKSTICQISFIKNLFIENGFVENMQSVLLFFSILLLLKIIIKREFSKLINTFIFLKILALTYYLGEEISWGQHFFNWKTPVFFTDYNNQNETNLHNISNLFDQLPRWLVILWCGFIPIIFYFFNNKFLFKNEINLIILPKKILLFISLLVLLFFLPDFLIDRLNLHPGYDDATKDTIQAIIIDFITFNYVHRLSELQELVFCFYFLIYAISFNKELALRKEHVEIKSIYE